MVWFEPLTGGSALTRFGVGVKTVPTGRMAGVGPGPPASHLLKVLGVFVDTLGEENQAAFLPRKANPPGGWVGGGRAQRPGFGYRHKALEFFFLEMSQDGHIFLPPPPLLGWVGAVGPPHGGLQKTERRKRPGENSPRGVEADRCGQPCVVTVTHAFGHRPLPLDWSGRLVSGGGLIVMLLHHELHFCEEAGCIWRPLRPGLSQQLLKFYNLIIPVQPPKGWLDANKYFQKSKLRQK